MWFLRSFSTDSKVQIEQQSRVLRFCYDLAKRLGCPLLTARLPCGTEEFRYRCFLPDLTGFAAPSCTGPKYQQSTSDFETYQVERSSIYSRLLLPTPALTHVAERGGFEPPVLFWSTHDFQSCTFNRSVTSPVCNFKNLRALPCSTDRQCLPKCLHYPSLSQAFAKIYHGPN